MRPFDVENDLGAPAKICGRHRLAAGLVDLRERCIGQAELYAELVKVVGDIRVVVGIDDGDRRACAVGCRACERHGVEAVGGSDLCG